MTSRLSKPVLDKKSLSRWKKLAWLRRMGSKNEVAGQVADVRRLAQNKVGSM
jgi:hypothetical protein